MTPTLLDLAQKLDRLDPTADWKQRTDLGEQMKKILGARAGEFSRRYDEIVTHPAENVLHRMGLLEPDKAEAAPPRVDPAAAGAAPTPEAPPTQDAPPLTEEEQLKIAAAAYRRFKNLSQKAQVSEDEIKAASLAWQDARAAVPEGAEVQGKLKKAMERVDQEIAEERARPAIYPHQLQGVIRRAPEAKK